MQLKTKKRLKNTLKIIVALYLVGGIALWYLQDTIFFHPRKIRAGEEFSFKGAHMEVNSPVDASSILNFVKFIPTDTGSTKGIVLYFHGNRDNINRYAAASTWFTKHGYEVWMPDYPGFGKTTGKFKEERLYDDAHVLYKLAAKRFSPDQMIIYGRSLGTGVATELASSQACKKLILETPYYSLTELAGAHFPMYPVKFLVRYKFPLHEYLQMVKVPVTIFHGTNDAVIPYKHSSRLKPLLKKGDEFITIEEGKHNNLGNFSLFQQKLDSLLR
jgi:alpha-beta hydrolase superfamily lysophospholipase